ncbi:MAG: diguanylate cyclase domain-containing protein [Acidimicrobiia bacterium]
MSTLDVVTGVEAAGQAGPTPDELRRVTGWQQILDAIPGAVLLVGPNGLIVHANEALARMTGYRAEDLNGRAVELLVPEDLRLAHFGERFRYHRHPGPRAMGAGLDVACRRVDGTTFPVDVRLAPLPLDGVTYVMATVTDETERVRREEELLRRSVHDPLTGLPNRVLLADRMTQALARARRQGTRVSVFYLDVDGFKQVNDGWGHAVGDEVLRAVGGRLRAAVRPADTVARVGGDEFVVLCDGLTAPGAASEIAQRLLDAVARPIHHPTGMVALTASVGSACTVHARTSPDTLLEVADQAMYRAKRAGGGRYRRETRR